MPTQIDKIIGSFVERAMKRARFQERLRNIYGINGFFVAEVKTKSPTGSKARKEWTDLFDVALTYGEWVAVHTEPQWGGTIVQLGIACELAMELPPEIRPRILAKGIHASDEQLRDALAHGADAALVVGRVSIAIPREKLWFEPSTLDGLQETPSASIAVWNSRDLNAAMAGKEKSKAGTFSEARYNRTGKLIQASYIRTVDDVERSADGFIVGTHLEEFIASVTEPRPL